MKTKHKKLKMKNENRKPEALSNGPLGSRFIHPPIPLWCF